MDLFIARQPIFTKQQTVYGYELLFRSGSANVFSHPDPDQASARVIVDSVFQVGLPTLTGRKRAFINFTRDLLVQGAALLLPKEQAVIEVLETVQPEADTLAACRRLKAAGYLLALDDFNGGSGKEALVELANIIKVDFAATDGPKRQTIVRQYAPRGIRMLAEKVETPEDFRQAVEAGYTYFQGYFFAKPAMLKSTRTPENRVTYIALLQEVLRPEINIARVATVMSRDVTLTYKLLRYINSPFFGFRRRIASIMEGLMLLGEGEVRRWASVIGLACLGADKPAELVTEAAVRARFGEALAGDAGFPEDADHLFMIGLLSLLDALLDRPLPELLSELPIVDAVKGPLLGRPSRLRDVHDCVLAYVHGEWGQLADLMKRLNLKEAHVPVRYREAVLWAQQMLVASSPGS